MTRLIAWLLAATVTFAAHAEIPTPVEPPKLSATEIIARNAKARGGNDAWRKTETMVWSGHTESSTNPERKLPFLLELKRPDRTRFEIATGSGRSLRIYDGTNGWKMRPDSRGVPSVEDYTADELDYARGAQVIDGPLMYYAARQATFKVAGLATVEGQDAYVLTARLPSGDGGRIWVDAKTFLEIRFDRDVRTRSGRSTTGSVFYRDYREFKGLKLPVVIETGSEAAKASNKLVIEKVAINPTIDDKTFEKPPILPKHRGGIVVDTRGVVAGPPAPPARPPQPSPPPPAAQPQPQP
jgi:outer membrane lipoprotein-sorting protein